MEFNDIYCHNKGDHVANFDSQILSISWKIMDFKIP